MVFWGVGVVGGQATRGKIRLADMFREEVRLSVARAMYRRMRCLSPFVHPMSSRNKNNTWYTFPVNSCSGGFVLRSLSVRIHDVDHSFFLRPHNMKCIDCPQAEVNQPIPAAPPLDASCL